MNNLNLEHLKSQAKDLLKAWKSGDPAAAARCSSLERQNLASVQWLIAQENGFPTWPALKSELDLRELARQEASTLSQDWLLFALGQGYQFARREKAAKLLERKPALAELSLGHAALAGRSDLLEQGLTRNPEALGTPHTERGMTLLALAAASVGSEEGALASIKLLLDRGADPNMIFGTHDWPNVQWQGPALYYAAGLASSVERSRLLLEAGADPNDNESLYHGVESGNVALMDVLVSHGARWKGVNALPRLLDFENLAMVERAIELGALDHDESPYGGILHHALRRGRSLAVIQKLVQGGASLTLPGVDGDIPYVYATRLGRSDVTSWLDSQGLGSPLTLRQSFLAAAADGRLDDALALRSQLGEALELTPLELRLLPDLAQVGCQRGVETLVALGWPIATPGDWDGSALNQACFNGDVEMVKLLLRFGASWEEKNGYGGDAWGSIYWASRNIPEQGRPGRHVECAQALLEAGSPLPDMMGGGDDVQEFLMAWREDHPDWPIAELS